MMETYNERDIFKIEGILWKDNVGQKRNMLDYPKLLHYTSMDTLYGIFQSREIWFSNPVNMNDIEEISFGFDKCRDMINNNVDFRNILEHKNMENIFYKEFDNWCVDFLNSGLQDIHIFCLSEDCFENMDGKLSMWRGYGNNGKGVALIFDFNKWVIDEKRYQLFPVRYMDKNSIEIWMLGKIKNIVDFLEKHIVKDEDIQMLAFQVYKMIQHFSLIVKHNGFAEEKEWRIISKSSDKKSCHCNDMGICTKYKTGLESLFHINDDKKMLEDVINGIIIGPNTDRQKRVIKNAIKALMLETGWDDKSIETYCSSIPYRSR